MTRKARLLLHGKKSATDSWLSADEEPRRGPTLSLDNTRPLRILYPKISKGGTDDEC